jgi:hypothetical protein
MYTDWILSVYLMIISVQAPVYGQIFSQCLSVQFCSHRQLVFIDERPNWCCDILFTPVIRVCCRMPELVPDAFWSRTGNACLWSNVWVHVTMILFTLVSPSRESDGSSSARNGCLWQFCLVEDCDGPSAHASGAATTVAPRFWMLVHSNIKLS